MERLFHVVEAQQFDKDLMTEIFSITKEMEEVVSRYGSNILNRRIMATLFYEPSTRTRLSFESAMLRLGGQVATTESAREFSSAAKGETLEDTIRIVEGYADVIVLRHYDGGSARRAADVASVPILNAGDGPGQHPTQALLDMYTIQKEIGKLDGVSVAMVGDLANGRTVRSLAYLLARYEDVKITFVAPEVVAMKDDIKEYLDRHNVKWEEAEDLLEVARTVDVVYMTRIQRERFGDRVEDYESARGKYIIDQSVMDVLQDHARVLHPLPRVDEIESEVDADPRAAYFRQAHNGLYVRMALLRMVFEA
jgi:aspartate carbamoyltransferase catalytic subunit